MIMSPTVISIYLMEPGKDRARDDPVKYQAEIHTRQTHHYGTGRTEQEALENALHHWKKAVEIPAVITAEYFKASVGRDPVNDELNRCNCERAGELGHYHCGWNREKNLPRYMTEPLINKKD